MPVYFYFLFLHPKMILESTLFVTEISCKSKYKNSNEQKKVMVGN